jgi:hypothetical protein
MPAAIAHYLHAKAALEQYGASRIGHLSQTAFLWGAQGPHFFESHLVLGRRRGEGLGVWLGKLQAVPAMELAQWMRHYAEGRPGPAASYALGFLCHNALDETVHPFVRYGAAMLNQIVEPSTEEICHNMIESALDTILLRYTTAQLPTELPLVRTLPRDPEVQRMISELYCDLIADLFGETVALEAIYQATCDCRKAYARMTDRTGLKKQFAEYIEKKRKRPAVRSCRLRGLCETDEYDYANIQHAQWQWPIEGGEPCEADIFMLFEQAVERGVRLIECFVTGAPLEVNQPGDKGASR